MLGSHNRLETLVEHFRHGWSSIQSLVPRPSFGVLCLPFLPELCSHEMRWKQDGPMPWDKGKVGIGAFVTTKVWFPSFLEVTVDDADDTIDPEFA